MIHINLLKPGIELFTKSRKEGKEWVVDIGIVHFELKISPGMVMIKLKDKKR